MGREGGKACDRACRTERSELGSRKGDGNQRHQGCACAEVVGQSCGVVCVGGSGTVITTTDSHHQRAYYLPSGMLLFTDHNGRVLSLEILEASTTDAASEKQPNIAKLK